MYNAQTSNYQSPHFRRNSFQSNINGGDFYQAACVKLLPSSIILTAWIIMFNQTQIMHSEFCSVRYGGRSYHEYVANLIFNYLTHILWERELLFMWWCGIIIQCISIKILDYNIAASISLAVLFLICMT